MAASSSSASRRLLRSVFRSAVRFERSPSVRAMGLNVNIAAFDLDQNDVKGDKAVLETGRDLVNLFKHVLRTRPATASNLDKALDALRRLNIIHADIKERHKRWQLREESPLWKQQVTFADAEENEPESAPTPAVATRSLPLFVLGNCFYPEGETWLHVFEPRYRTMMRDVADADECFGHIFSDGTGRVASVGTLCQVVFREVLDDGRQAIRVRGIGRFRVREVLKAPQAYTVAEVETGIADVPLPDTLHNAAASAQLEKDTWAALKYYLRLMHRHEKTKSLRVTPFVKAHRPTPDTLLDAARRERFSFSVANMVQTAEPFESQLLLQTRNSVHRLQAQRAVLTAAAGALAKRLLETGLLTEAERVAIEVRSREDDAAADTDVLPP